MASASPARRLVVNADDFGRSASINAAVIRAHREGILTSASLMVNGDAFEEAVTLARAHPEMGVGLHLTLICGSATLPAAEIPGLVNARGEFGDNPVRVGIKYFFKRELRGQLTREIAAQFDKFRATGLPLDHVNGHLNLHLHPAILPILARHATAWGIRHMRLTWDPFWLNTRLAGGRWFYRAGHALIFRWLSARARPVFRQLGLLHTGTVFGLLQNAFVDADFIARLLPALPPGDSELYSHPSLDQFRNEFEALLCPRVKELVQRHNIELIRYQDL